MKSTTAMREVCCGFYENFYQEVAALRFSDWVGSDVGDGCCDESLQVQLGKNRRIIELPSYNYHWLYHGCAFVVTNYFASLHCGEPCVTEQLV